MNSDDVRHLYLPESVDLAIASLTGKIVSGNGGPATELALRWWMAIREAQQRQAEAT